MAEVPEYINEKITARILRDLSPRPLVVHTKVAASAAFGGGASLLLCGQFGLGLTTFAENFNHLVHTHTNSVACALICGSLFAVLPALLLRILCPYLQFKAIVRRQWRVLVLWFGTVGAALAYLGDHGRTLLELGTWTIAAVVAFRLLSWAIEQLKLPRGFAEMPTG
jgi:hypothetical protein